MPTVQARLEDIDARLANAQARLEEAERELILLRNLGHPTRAVEIGLALLAETVDSLVATKQFVLRTVLSHTSPTVDSAFLLAQAARCRELAETAIKWTIRQGLADIAQELERAAGPSNADPPRSVSTS